MCGVLRGERGERIRVLCVDDEPGLAEIVSEFLERENDRFEAVAATSASEGLDRLADERFDCIVSDYQMPEMDGLAFLAEVREDHPELPFVLFTGKGSEEIASEAIARGVTDYLQKEGGTDQYTVLSNRVANAVEQYRSKRAVEAAERQQRELTEATDDVLWMVTADWEELLFVNSAYGEIWGQSVERLRSDPRSFVEGVHPDDSDRVRRGMERLSNGQSVDVEFRVNADEDFGRWVWVQGEPIVEDGDVARIVGSTRDVTERRERERALEREHERFSALFENTLEPIVVYEFEDGTPVIRSVNDAFEETFGYDGERAVGGSLDDLLVPEEKREEARRLDQRVLAGEQVEAELRRLTADGERYFRFRNVPIPGGEGADGFAIYTDVTGQERRQRELRELKEEYETVFTNAQDALFLVDVDRSGSDVEFRIRRANPAHAETTGLSTADVRGKTPREAFDGAVGEQVAANYRRCLAERDTITYEEQLAMPAGTITWQTKLTPVVVDGEVTQIVGSARDITALRDRERQVQRERDRFEALFEAIPEPVVTVDVSGDAPELRDVNEAFEETFGYDAAEVVGENLNDLVVPPDERAAAEAMDERAMAGEEITREVRRETGDGVREFLFRSTPVDHDLAGGHQFGLYIDITERKQRERELQRQNERLDRFTSIVTHDLRNPIEVAHGGLELVRGECDAEHLDTIDDALTRMETIIGETLTLARQGRAVGDQEPVDLGDLVGDCWAGIETGEAALNVADEVTVRGDPDRLQHVFENLFRNSVEHGSTGSRPEAGDSVEHGGEAVTVRVGRLDGEAGFYVADDGDGVPPDERDAIFDPGYSGEEEGTGFGLAIVEEVVEAHGWTVDVTESREGGARFEVTGVDLVE